MKAGESLMTQNDTVILACTSLCHHLAMAQQRMQTDFTVIPLDRSNHVAPEKMKACIQQALDSLPPGTDTVLAAIGYCGGSWDGIRTPCRTVLPNLDDCITLLLHTDDTPHGNLKQTGHMYMTDGDMEDYTIRGIKDRLCRRYGLESGMRLFASYFQHYTHVDIIDTGVYDCHSAPYLSLARENAALIDGKLSHVPGSNRILEKLVSGRWDRQFQVCEAGSVITRDTFTAL